VPVLAGCPRRQYELRIFNRDGKKILGTRRPIPRRPTNTISCSVHEKRTKQVASVPVAVFIAKDFGELHATSSTRPSHKGPHPDISRAATRRDEEQRKERDRREFCLQGSPFS